jgi:8-oxo-dGTP pyrophosphatase MutT (NUDIX family)
VIKPWKRKKHKVDYDCGFFQVHVDHSASPVTGKEHPFFILSTHDWTNVIALTPAQEVLMVSQYRHGSGEVSLEIPGGAVEPGESPLKAAQRELREETGYRATRWKSLGSVRPNPAILDNTCYFFLALDAKPAGELDLDEAEELEVSLHDLKDIPRLIRRGGIRHSLVIAAFHFFDLLKSEKKGKFAFKPSKAGKSA